MSCARRAAGVRQKQVIARQPRVELTVLSVPGMGFTRGGAEDGTSTPMLLARSRHASVRSLERYARPGVDAVARHVAERDPAARRRS
ncbi:hypothetical protein SRIMM317S_07006 [Streptomyces rimosus subsp. rimosus]